MTPSCRAENLRCALDPAVQCAPRTAYDMQLEDSVTGLIRAWTGGDRSAGERLFARVYDELRTIARRRDSRFRRTGADDTLDTTALVHEVYLRLSSAGDLRVENREHFFAIAVRAVRQIVSNYARHATAAKRGGGAVVESLDAARVAAPALDERALAIAEDIDALDAALRTLEAIHPRPCRVVECRYFAGLSIPETAAVLAVSEATVKRDWAVAQAWLHRALRGER